MEAQKSLAKELGESLRLSSKQLAETAAEQAALVTQCAELEAALAAEKERVPIGAPAEQPKAETVASEPDVALLQRAQEAEKQVASLQAELAELKAKANVPKGPRPPSTPPPGTPRPPSTPPPQAAAPVPPPPPAPMAAPGPPPPPPPGQPGPPPPPPPGAGPPPPPGPPAPPGLASAAAKPVPLVKPSVPVVSCPWKKLPRNRVNGSLWQKSDYVKLPADIYTQVEQAFHSRPPAAKPKLTQTVKVVSILDPKRSQALNILISRFKHPLPDMVQAIRDFGTSG